jgi:transcriptional regulator with XRE-family HTH domain
MRVYVIRYTVKAFLQKRPEGTPGMPLTIAPDMPRKKYEETSFGKRLAALRKARGLTQVQLAKVAGTTQRAISYYENEAGFPPAPAVMDLARALRVSTDELLGIRPQPREVSKLEQLHSDPESRRLWKRFQQMAELPEKDQRAVIRLINSLSTVRASEARA